MTRKIKVINRKADGGPINRHKEMAMGKTIKTMSKGGCMNKGGITKNKK